MELAFHKGISVGMDMAKGAMSGQQFDKNFISREFKKFMNELFQPIK